MLELILIASLYVISLVAFRVLGGFQAASEAVQGWGSSHARIGQGGTTALA
jgi:hypothetical protein